MCVSSYSFLSQALQNDIVFDGWPVPAAMQFLLELAGCIDPLAPYLSYGVAEEDCPYPVLGKGIAASPKWRFTAGMTLEFAWNAIESNTPPCL